MSRLLMVLTAAGIALVSLAIAVFVAGDRHTVVPPPESVAQGLLRQLATRRYRQTRQFLSASARSTYTPERLREWVEQLESRLGRMQTVRGEVMDVTGETALVRVTVAGREGKSVVQIRLQRQHGLWLITKLPPTSAVPSEGDLRR
jgi:hypothetical protein